MFTLPRYSSYRGSIIKKKKEKTISQQSKEKKTHEKYHHVYTLLGDEFVRLHSEMKIKIKKKKKNRLGYS